MSPGARLDFAASVPAGTIRQEGRSMVESQGHTDRSSALRYLEIASRFRQHEFAMQMLRNAVFTGFQAVLLGSYAATIAKTQLAGAAIAGFGVALAALWWFAFRGSLYWCRFWEVRCREINDYVLTLSSIEANLFEGHPAGASGSKPPTVRYNGRRVRYTSSQKALKLVPLAFAFLWLALLAVSIL